MLGIIGIPYLSTRIDRSRGNIGEQGIMGIPYLSTCLPGLAGPGINIGVLGIMGITYLSTCLPGLTGLVLDKVLYYI